MPLVSVTVSEPVPVGASGVPDRLSHRRAVADEGPAGTLAQSFSSAIPDPKCSAGRSPFSTNLAETTTGADISSTSKSWTPCVRQDGTLIDVSITNSPIRGPGGGVRGWSTIARDISDRRKAEEVKDGFLTLVSHELRTPLSAIIAHVELLLDDDLSDPALGLSR